MQELLINLLSEVQEEASKITVLCDNIAELIKEPKECKEQEVIQEVKVTREELRAKLASLSKDGYTKKVKELLLKYGANKLSELDESKFNQVMKDAEEIGNA